MTRLYYLTLQRLFRFGLLAAVSGLLVGCATMQNCATSAPSTLNNEPSIYSKSLSQENTLPPHILADVQCLADRQDNRQAQLQMGLHLESTAKGEADLERAASYYQRASEALSDKVAVYVPGVNGAGGTVGMFDRPGGARPALAVAKYYLALLYLTGKGVKLNRSKAIGLLKDAAKAGNNQAIIKLNELHVE
jgi:TPR repeat protein